MRAKKLVHVMLADLPRIAASPPNKRFYAPLLPPPRRFSALGRVEIEPVLNVGRDHFIDPK